MNKARIYQSGSCSVTMEADCPWSGERKTREFWVPTSGGYVREGDKQVCDMLSSRGNTLYVSDPADLLGLIRRERKRELAWERRELNHGWR